MDAERKIIFDSHCHIQFAAYDNDRKLVIERARDRNVKMIAVGTQIPTSEAVIQLARQYPEDIWATVGFHPIHLAKDWHYDAKERKEAAPPVFEADKLRILARDSKVVAIGECGLDYYRMGAWSQSPDNGALEIKNLQKEVFLQQIELAEELRKPLMIHCRPSKNTYDAYDDLLAIIYGMKISVPKIIHFFVGNLEIAEKLTALGCFFTVGGVITFVREYDEAISYIPVERLLLETDCPYVAPEPYRGKRNEPVYITETAGKLAELKGLNLEKILKITSFNAKMVFNL